MKAFLILCSLWIMLFASGCPSSDSDPVNGDQDISSTEMDREQELQPGDNDTDQLPVDGDLDVDERDQADEDLDLIADGDLTETEQVELDADVSVDGDKIEYDLDTSEIDSSDSLEPDSEGDGDGDGDGDTESIADGDSEEVEDDSDLMETDSEEELGCIRGEEWCSCLPNDECLDEENICRDGICEYCAPGHHYCPCRSEWCLYDRICYEGICLDESEIDGDEEIVCPGGMNCPCYPDETCQEGLECRLGTICLEECWPDHLGTYGCMCAGNFCYDVETTCVNDICIPKAWVDGDQ